MYPGFIVRLAIVLPLVLASIVATLVLLKYGRTRLQGGLMPRGRPVEGKPDRGRFAPLLARIRPSLARHRADGDDSVPFQLLARTTLTPAATLAVVRFAGETHLLGVTAAGVTVLASEPAPGLPDVPCVPARPREAA